LYEAGVTESRLVGVLFGSLWLSGCGSAPPPPPVEPQVQAGELPFSEVQRALAPAKEQAQRCFRQAASRDARATGTVVIAFTVQPDGSVTNTIANSETTFGDALAAQCIVNAVNELDFPRATQATAVEYPFDGPAPAPASNAPSRERIAESVQKRQGAFDACYEPALAKDRSLTSQLVVRFRLEPSGLVSKARLSPRSELRDPELVRCALRVFSGLILPATETGFDGLEYALPVSR
jgi:hypothetical protein